MNLGIRLLGRASMLTSYSVYISFEHIVTSLSLLPFTCSFSINSVFFITFSTMLQLTPPEFFIVRIHHQNISFNCIESEISYSITSFTIPCIYFKYIINKYCKVCSALDTDCKIHYNF
jgi:hypothetical protein